MGLMDQYFMNDIGEHVVPRDLDLLDRVESPDSWLQWGLNNSESFGSLNKCFFPGTETAGGELKFNGESLCNEADKEPSVHDGDRSSGSSIGGGFSEASLHSNTLSHDQLCYQLDDLAETDQIDTLFLTPFEDLPDTENFKNAFCFSPELQLGTMSANHLMEDMILDSQGTSSNLYGTGSTKYLRSHTFSPSVDWDGEVVSNLYPNPCDSGQKDLPPAKAPMIKFLVPPETNDMEGHVHEKISFEESVLRELEAVMAQLPEKTRICFRDALYRLARNPERCNASQAQNRDLPMEKLHPLTVSDETLRPGRTAATELATNSIDRVVANLLYNKMDLNAQHLPSASSVNFDEDSMTRSSGSYGLSQPESYFQYSRCPSLIPGDAENGVPIFCRETEFSV